MIPGPPNVPKGFGDPLVPCNGSLHFRAIIPLVLLPYYYFYIFLVSLIILNVEGFVPKKKPVP